MAIQLAEMVMSIVQKEDTLDYFRWANLKKSTISTNRRQLNMKANICDNIVELRLQTLENLTKIVLI